MADRANGMKFLVLGPLDVAGNGESALGGPKQRAVLGMLVSRVGQSVSNDSLADGIWGEDLPSEVSTSLRSYVSNLRAAIGADIERSGGGNVLNADPASVDAIEFVLPRTLSGLMTGGSSPKPTCPGGESRL